MGYEVDEMNFVLMHKEVVFQVESKSNMPTALNMLKINQIVMKHKPVNETEIESDFGNIQQGQSKSKKDLPSTSGVIKSPKKQKTKAKSKVEKVQMVTASTQTTEEMFPVNLPDDEEDFNMFHLQAMRQKYLVTTIREQDFEENMEEPENQN